MTTTLAILFFIFVLIYSHRKDLKEAEKEKELEQLAQELADREREELAAKLAQAQIDKERREQAQRDQEQAERKRQELARLAQERAENERKTLARLAQEQSTRKEIEDSIRKEILCKAEALNHLNPVDTPPNTNTRNVVPYQVNSSQESIKRIVRERQIRYLVHFTPVDNIQSILENGVVSRASLDQNHTFYTYNDGQRLDNKKNASCLSISLPNYRYFFSLRKQRYQDRTWCVVLLKPSILWEMDCAFFQTNAANNIVRHRPVQEFKGPQALNKMFDSSLFNRKSLEQNHRLPVYCTTDPQAEVLVFDRISPDYIEGLAFENNVPYWLKNMIPNSLSHIHLIAEPAFGTNTFFGRRCDYSFWQNKQTA